MIIFVAGVHGCGKTTLINNLDLDLPVTKILSIDMNPKLLHNNPCASNQFIRHADYFNNVEPDLNKSPDHTIIVDRAPVSLAIYDQALNELGVISDEAYKDLCSDYEVRFKLFSSRLASSLHKSVTFFMDVPLKQVKQNIINRGRSKTLNEDDWAYLSKVYDLFKTAAKKHGFRVLKWDDALSVKDNYDEMALRVKGWINVNW